MRLEFDTAKAERRSERENDPPANGATQKARKRRWGDGEDGIGGRKKRDETMTFGRPIPLNRVYILLGNS